MGPVHLMTPRAVVLRGGRHCTRKAIAEAEKYAKAEEVRIWLVPEPQT
jgi:hypothetical protein